MPVYFVAPYKILQMISLLVAVTVWTVPCWCLVLPIHPFRKEVRSSRLDAAQSPSEDGIFSVKIKPIAENPVPTPNIFINNRRCLLNTFTATTVSAIGPRISGAAATGEPILGTTTTTTSSSSTTTTDTVIQRLPLDFVPALGAYVVHYRLFGERFGGIVDTGSPFLTVPSTCNRYAYKYLWGCYRPERTRDSGYGNTVEGYNSNTGIVVWRKADFSWDGNNTDTIVKEDMVFGVFGPALLDGPGGVFFGLIQETAQGIRPSFLGQTRYQSFGMDLRDRQNAQLVLSTDATVSLLPSATEGADQDYIVLTSDLYRKYKAPVNHYTVRAHSFVVNGLPLKLDDRRRPTYVIFDTGVTGMVVSQELFDGRYLQARKLKEKSLWGSVHVSFLTNTGRGVELSATKPITTPLGKANPFQKFQGNLIVLGLAFLDGHAMTIDVPNRRLRLD